MSSNFTRNLDQYTFQRYPLTKHQSLKPFNSADVLVLDSLDGINVGNRIHVFNDRFGFWNCMLHEKEVLSIWTHQSERKAIFHNLKIHNLPVYEHSFFTPLDPLNTVELALIKVPKSLELFELYIQQIHKAATKETTVLCGFMTKYFNDSLLKIGSKYFEEVQQSLAWKKARVLILSHPKTPVEHSSLMNSISWNGHLLKQYFGVFSSKKIDLGTQFLLENLTLKQGESKILDLASGNGVIAHEILKRKPKIHVTLVDDSNLAVESSRLNVSGNTHFLCDDNLSQLEAEAFDLVVSNPPFHFEYENNIEVSVQLFDQVSRVLQPKGRFVLVANTHLNYSTHLKKFFKQVVQLKANRKFEVLECIC